MCTERAVERSLLLSICTERPRVIEGPKDVTVQEATDVLFRCQSNPDPDVTVIWKKQNGQIPPGRSVCRHFQQSSSGIDDRENCE